VETLVNEQKLKPSSSELGHNQVYDKKQYQVTADLLPFRISQLKRMEKNSIDVIEFLYSKMREGNLKPASRTSTIDRLCQLSTFLINKPFIKMTSNDIFDYLDSIRKTESEDPLQVDWYLQYFCHKNYGVLQVVISARYSFK
jgi:hypothetical protein